MATRSQDSADPIRFTIAPRPHGFTDQMLQFAVLYRLGRSLGWTYRHTPFASPFSSPPPPAPGDPSLRAWLAGLPQRLVWRGPRRGLVPIPEIYEFLGFNRHFEERDEMADARPDRVVDLPIVDRWLRENGATTAEGVQKLVSERAAAALGDDRDRLVRLRITAGRRFFGTVLAGTSPPRDGPDLRAIYEQARGREPWRSLYRGRGLRILLHIRQGDTAALETPWSTWLPLWPRSHSTVFREYGRLGAIPDRRHLRVRDFVPLAQAFGAVLAPRSYSMLAFSDGFERSFSFLRSIRHRVALPPERIDAVLATERGYEAKQFRRLERLDDCRCIVGESPRKLCDFVESALKADVIVVGGQQRLVPKLLATYCTPDTMPLVIVLHRGGGFGRAPRRFYQIVGLGRRADCFAFMDARKPDSAALAGLLEDRFGGNPRFRPADGARPPTGPPRLRSPRELS